MPSVRKANCCIPFITNCKELTAEQLSHRERDESGKAAKFNICFHFPSTLYFHGR
jgi:hypothetical protein